MKKNNINKFLMTGLGFLSLDILTKAIVRMFLNESLEIIPNFFRLSNVKNTGALFGSFKDSRIMLIVFSFVIFILLVYMYSEENKKIKLINYGYMLLFAGLFGNLIDRVFRGYVVDFLDFNIFKYQYPVFNLADIYIVVGVFLLLINEVRGVRKYETR